ncbi:class I SAM-dependent methyltransferase [Cylindrospermum stagnale]|nr:class I SAM-dependent methyltransferase [Cylindrospermum stagnale]
MNNYKQQVTKFFNLRTAYDQEGKFHPRLANRLLECLSLHSGQRILDVATGTGLIAIAAAQQVGSEGYVLGVDISAGMLNQARQKIETAGLQNIELMEADADFLDFQDESFDIIFCSSALVYLTDISNALQNWYRFLKKGGIVAFSCFSETSFMADIQKKVCSKLFGISLQHINEPLGTPSKCYQLLQQAGFDHIEVKTEQFGEYLSLSDRRMLWNGGGFYPRGNSLQLLSQTQLELLQAEYTAEMERLVTDQGVWYEIAAFFVLAHK